MEECKVKKYTREEVNFMVKCPILKVNKKLPEFVLPKERNYIMVLSKIEEMKIKKEI